MDQCCDTASGEGISVNVILLLQSPGFLIVDTPQDLLLPHLCYGRGNNDFCLFVASCFREVTGL